jgi:hypothetical protein
VVAVQPASGRPEVVQMGPAQVGADSHQQSAQANPSRPQVVSVVPGSQEPDTVQQPAHVEGEQDGVSPHPTSTCSTWPKPRTRHPGHSTLATVQKSPVFSRLRVREAASPPLQKTRTVACVAPWAKAQ